MQPGELVDLCTDAIARWNSGEQITQEPTIMLVVPRTTCPAGDTVFLFGRSGPRGRIATVKETSIGYDVVAYFPAVATLNAIAAATGVKIAIEKKRPPARA